jgi:hypothetical protein
MMPENDDKLTRRDAIKTITAGAGLVVSLPVLGAGVFGQTPSHEDHAHGSGMAAAAGRKEAEKPQPLKFFTAEENRILVDLTERIIPSDDSSPGSKEARVSEYIDLVVSESPETTRQLWREGISMINKNSIEMFGKPFADASIDQQVLLLKQLSKNEVSPSSAEERFFRTVKNATIDGYYTSKIGIHQELHYKGNSYLKEFTGCTHPEHQS